jgi:hypothetical protein
MQAPSGGVAQPEGLGQLGEGMTYLPVAGSSAGAGDEECRWHRPRAEPVALGGIGAQGLGRARVQRHQARAAEFRIPDDEHPIVEIGVLPAQG